LRRCDRPALGNADNLPRLHDESDLVRYEIVTALGGDGLVVVPTLVEGAEVPKAGDLPPALQPLFDLWNARKVTEDGWEDDARRLIGEISEASRLPIERIVHRCPSRRERIDPHADDAVAYPVQARRLAAAARHSWARRRRAARWRSRPWSRVDRRGPPRAMRHPSYTFAYRLWSKPHVPPPFGWHLTGARPGDAILFSHRCIGCA
jgi:hypothetical protein